MNVRALSAVGLLLLICACAPQPARETSGAQPAASELWFRELGPGAPADHLHAAALAGDYPMPENLGPGVGVTAASIRECNNRRLMPGSDVPWYADGLCFSCTGCGHCCRIEGHVWVSGGEVEAIARHLHMDLDTFGRRFLRRVGARLALIDKPNRDCVFWEEGCEIYPARPEQCRNFPFWRENLASQTAWQTAAAECEGIGVGRLYRLAEIESLARGQGATSDDEPVADNR